MTNASRIFSALICALAIAALAAQFMVVQGRTSSLGATLWGLAGYFTILTNCLIAVAFGSQAFGRRLTGREAAAVTISIVMVGIVYQILLYRPLVPWSLRWWADLGLHRITPILTALWWLRFAPRTLTLRDLPFCLIWPMAYCAYALVRGAATGFFPYPFLNAGRLGWDTVAVNVTGMALAFAAMALMLVAASRFSR
ncbi:MAG: Pr6Pr family membrane protein [Pseudorhodobacter sp.]